MSLKAAFMYSNVAFTENVFVFSKQSFDVLFEKYPYIVSKITEKINL